MPTPSYDLFCDPSFGQTVKTDCCTGNNVGTIGGNCSAIFGGDFTNSHLNNADLSVILMGDTNTINTFGSIPVNGTYNTIGNGNNNTGAGFYLNIFNGHLNTAAGCYVGISNGCTNNLGPLGATDSCYSDIGNGCENTNLGSFSTIANGFCNCINGIDIFIGTGSRNKVISSVAGTPSGSVIAGGSNNCITDNGT